MDKNLDMSFSVIIGVKSAYKKYSDATVSCVVLDSDISTGNALVFNLETERVQIVTPTQRLYVMDAVKNIVRSWPEETKDFYRKKMKKELQKNYVSL